MAMVCSQWADSEPSAVDDVQPSSSDPGLAPADVHHRLDGEHHPGLQLRALAGLAVVRHLRLLVHRRADGVAHVLPHDREPGRLGDRLHGVADVGQPVAVDHLRDAGVEDWPR